MKEVILTPEGYKKLKQELDAPATDKRREVAERIAAAREFGDIAENAEYDDAKNEQAMLEHRIAQLEERLANARVIDKKRRRHERRLGRLGRPPARRRREGDDRVPHRRLGRGEPGRAQALERVARRQGDHGPQEGRDRRGRHAARLEGEVQDHGDQGRVAGASAGRGHVRASGARRDSEVCCSSWPPSRPAAGSSSRRCGLAPARSRGPCFRRVRPRAVGPKTLDLGRRAAGRRELPRQRLPRHRRCGAGDVDRPRRAERRRHRGARSRRLLRSAASAGRR